MVTLTGPGGIGKTRLGVEVAWRVAKQFPDGVYFVPLAAVRRADGIVGAIVQVLGLRDRDDQAPDA